MGVFRELTARALKGERVYTGWERDRHDAGVSGQSKGTTGAKGLGASGRFGAGSEGYTVGAWKHT